jgi:hypothetical protein
MPLFSSVSPVRAASQPESLTADVGDAGEWGTQESSSVRAGTAVQGLYRRAVSGLYREARSCLC